jgi:glycosyltransferase involved in cell wall biosynthesis
LLKACRILKEKFSLNFKCDFYGNFLTCNTSAEDAKKMNKEKFNEIITKMGLENEVAYCGFLSAENKPSVLKNSDVLVLPTYYPGEGQPICIIEALASGMPVISTPLAGIPEQVIDSYNGFLVTPQDVPKLADRIYELASDRKKYIKFAKNALRHYHEHFQSEIHQEKMIKILTE